MSGTSKIDLLVLADEWERFVEYVDERYVANDRYIRQELESAMEEFIDRDGFAEIEERIDRLVCAAGRRPRDLSKNKILSEDAIENGEKTRVAIWVFADIRERFTIQAKEQSDHNLGVVLSLALREYRQGGRSIRIESKLDRVIEDAEAYLSEASGSDSLGKVERQVLLISRNIREKGLDTLISRTDLLDQIERVTNSDSDYMWKTYSPKVLDRLDMEVSPDNPQLYVRKEDAEQQRREDAEAEAEEQLDALDQGSLSPDGASVISDGGRTE